MRVRLLLLEKVGLLQQDAVTQQSGFYDVEVVSFSKRLCIKRSPQFINLTNNVGFVVYGF